MARGTVSLNSKPYVVEARKTRDGQTVHVEEYQVDPFAASFVPGGNKTLQAVDKFTPKVFLPPTGGFGRDRIPSDRASDAREYRRAWDIIADVWPDATRLPLLAQDSTETGLEVIRASANFKGNLWALWEDRSGSDTLSRKYVGSTTTWTAGGNVALSPTVDATSSGTDTASTTCTVSHTCSGDKRILVVGVTGFDTGAATSPTGVTYGGVAMTLLAGRSSPGGPDASASLWYLLNPASGANNIVATFALSQDGIVVGGVSFNNAAQVAVANAAMANGTGTLPTVNVTTTDGDVVVDVLAVDGTATATVGTGQTERWNTTAGAVVRGAGSTERASGSSTTMSWALGSSSNWAVVAASVQATPTVGLDMMPHRTHLLALVANEDDHLVKRSTDGATWSGASTQPTAGLLADSVTANEDIDAGMIAEIYGVAILALRDEDSGTITFFYSTDTGDTWTDKQFDIASANGPQGIAVMAGPDDADRLFLATFEGIYEIDTTTVPDSGTWTSRLRYPMTGHADNGRRMKVFQGMLFVGHGVDDNSPAPITAIRAIPGGYEFMEGLGLNGGDGVPSDLLGPIRWMQPIGQFLYFSVGGGAASRQARVLRGRFNEDGDWAITHMTQHGTANRKIEWIDVSANDDGVPRLHFAVRTGTAASDTQFLAYPNTNPQSGVTIPRENTGRVDYPFIDNGMPGDDAAWLRVRVDASGLSADDTGEYLSVDYGLEGAARTTDLGEAADDLDKFFSGAKSRYVGNTDPDNPVKEGVSGISFAPRVNLVSADASGGATPELHSLEVDFLKMPDILEGYVFTVNLEQSALLQSDTIENVIASLKTARGKKTLPALSYGASGTKYVKIREIRFLSEIRRDGGGGFEGAPDVQAERAGYAEIRCEEVT